MSMNHHLKERVQVAFINKFKIVPLLVFSPGRINFIGGHTDYNQGFVFPAAIDKGIYLAVAKTKASISTVVALDENENHQFVTEAVVSRVKDNSWKNYVLGVISEVRKTGKLIPNFNMVFSGDIPLGAGLSSSAALENSVIFALNELFNLEFTKKEMIIISQQAEHNFVGVKCGMMDQYASMFGEEYSALHLDCRTLNATSYSVEFKGYELVLINTNVKHSLAESAYNKRREVCEVVSTLLEVEALRDVTEEYLLTIRRKITEEDYQKALYVIQENERTLKAIVAIENSDIKTFGDLLFKSHKGLSKQYEVSCSELDFLVEKAQQSLAVIGARMMGGGFGGCTINIVKSSEKKSFLENIKQLYKQKFNRTCSVYEVALSNGTQIISK